MTDPRSRLIKLAAEILTSGPSEFLGDYDLPKTTPKGAKRVIFEVAKKSRSRHIRWARQVRKIADELKETSNE